MRLTLHFLAAAVFFSGAAFADSAQLAVAANFAEPAKEIAAAFEAASGHKLSLSSGATGKFYAQIVNGAPFDLLLAADEKTPARLEQEGHAVQGTRFAYAIGRLVLWSPQAGLVDDAGEILRTGSFRRLALANPRVAPYGQAAVEVMRAKGVAERLEARLVLGENIAQAYQFVATGNAELGFVALSQVMKNGVLKDGSAWMVPLDLHPPIRQDAVLLAKGKDNPAAAAFLAFLQSPPAQRIIANFGYALP